MARVLIIDDEAVLLEMLARICRKSGCDAQGCTTVSSALESLRTWHPDLVLVDYHIGPESGMEILEACQREFPDLPAIMITSERSPEVVIQALRFGVRDFFLKPLDPAELVSAIQRILSKLNPPVQAAEDSRDRAPAEDVPVNGLPVGSPLQPFIREQERRFVQATLASNGGSRDKTAAMLGVSIATLYRKLGPSDGRRQNA